MDMDVDIDMDSDIDIDTDLGTGIDLDLQPMLIDTARLQSIQPGLLLLRGSQARMGGIGAQHGHSRSCLMGPG